MVIGTDLISTSIGISTVSTPLTAGGLGFYLSTAN